MVRCKMKVQSLAKIDTSYNGTPALIDEVTLVAAHGPGNEGWSKHTPSGSVKLQITNPDAVGQFEAGKFYLVDFTPAE